MISKSAIEEFLDQELDDWIWIKSLLRSDLVKAIEDYTGFSFEELFKTGPRDIQLACYLLGLYNPSFLHLLDMGLGKSKIALDLFYYYYKIGEVKRCFLLVRDVSSTDALAEQIETHSKLENYVILEGTRAEREALLNSDSPIFILNYQGLPTLACDRRDNKNIINEDKINKLRKLFDFIVMDESQKVSNRKTLTTKICVELTKGKRHKYCLTGTPFGRDPQLLWSQFFIIDRGQTLGRYISMFRQAFFDEHVNPWGGYEYVLKENMKETLNRRIRNKSIRYEDKEAKDLPPRLDYEIPVRLPPENRKYYDKAEEALVTFVGAHMVMKAEFIRLRQVASGFVSFKTEEGEKKEVPLSEQPKLEVLIEYLLNMPEDSKAVVFVDFVLSGDIIQARFKKEKIPHVRLYGATKDKSGVIRKFKGDPSVKVLLANSQSGSASHNFQIANYVFFYESPVSYINRRQAEKRCWRMGQTKRTYIYDIVVQDSIEERILQFMSEGKSLFKELLNAKPEDRRRILNGKKLEFCKKKKPKR